MAGMLIQSLIFTIFLNETVNTTKCNRAVIKDYKNGYVSFNQNWNRPTNVNQN